MISWKDAATKATSLLLTDPPAPVVIPPIEESIDLSEPVRSVSERYYTPFYRVDANRERRHDLCLLVHSNRIALITLAPSHPVLDQGLVVKSLDCTINKKLDRKNNKAVGKSKKGGQNLFKDSVLCHLETEDGSRYPVEAVCPGKLITMNRAVIAAPQLITTKPQAEGHIAILLPYLGQIQECKDSLLTQPAYTALLQQERQAADR